MPQQRHEAPSENGAERSVRERIVGAARQHFLAHGFRGVTMADLAEELGMSKKTLYAHFTGKTELLEAVLGAKFNEVESELAAITGRSPSDFAAGLHAFLTCLQRHAAEIQPPFVRDVGRDAPEVFQQIERRRRELIERHFGKLLTEGRREGLIRKDVSVRLILEILLGTLQSVMNPPKLTELGLTPQTGLTAILTVVLEGVITSAGSAGGSPERVAGRINEA
jgi:AcrR family transcriptional regulator